MRASVWGWVRVWSDELGEARLGTCHLGTICSQRMRDQTRHMTGCCFIAAWHRRCVRRDVLRRWSMHVCPHRLPCASGARLSTLAAALGGTSVERKRLRCTLNQDTQATVQNATHGS